MYTKGNSFGTPVGRHLARGNVNLTFGSAANMACGE